MGVALPDLGLYRSLDSFFGRRQPGVHSAVHDSVNLSIAEYCHFLLLHGGDSDRIAHLEFAPSVQMQLLWHVPEGPHNATKQCRGNRLTMPRYPVKI